MPRIHVVAAVITNEEDKIFIAKRPAHLHQGGLWEFPGGKVEPGETNVQALQRELEEEIGIRLVKARPLIKIAHDYPDKSVLLDVWRVQHYEGTPHGRERQETQWVECETLVDYSFPAANRPIITACRLPDHYFITPPPQDEKRFLATLRTSLAGGIKLMQLRAKNYSEEAYRALATEAIAIAHEFDCKILLNASSQCVLELGADGVHLDSQQLAALRARPLPNNLWVGASCHNPQELKHAEKIGADFAVLSPVKATATHPGAAPLGWTTFEQWVTPTAIPVYALGGMEQGDRDQAIRCGAQGLAGIRGFWRDALALSS